MSKAIETPHGTVTFHNEWPAEKVQELLAQYAYRIGYVGKEKKNAA